MSHVRGREHYCFGLVAVSSAGAPEGFGRARKSQRHSRCKGVLLVSGRHLRNTILRFEQLRRFEPHCLFFGATERELATRGRAEGRGRVVHYIPNFFYQVDRVVGDETTVETFITTVAPMDEDGYFSLGTNSDYSFLLSRKSKKIIVEANRFMPRVHGPAQLHVSEVNAIVENDAPLEEFPAAPPKDLDPDVARNVVKLIPDGATLQMGIGSLPAVVCSFLDNHNDLGIHTELLTPPHGPDDGNRGRQQPAQKAEYRKNRVHICLGRSASL